VKQLSSAFVVVDETRDVTVCEYVTADRETVHRFAIMWDRDHDERVVEAIHALIVDGMMDYVDVIAESKGHLRVWSEWKALMPEVVHIDGDFWTTETQRGDGLMNDVRRVFACGLRPFVAGGAR